MMGDVLDTFELTGRTDSARFFMVKGVDEPGGVIEAVSKLVPKGSRHPWDNASRALEPRIILRPALTTWKVRVPYVRDDAVRFEEGEKPVDAVR